MNRTSGFIVLFAVGWGLSALMLFGAVKQSQLQVRKPSGDIATIKQDWNCDAYRCAFPGLDYTSPVDRRFERDRKN